MADVVPGVDGPVRDLPEKQVRAVRAAYFGLLSEIDHQLGRVFSYLDDEGLWDDTLIVFTSDHGEHLGDHHLFGKPTYFDESFRVPLIIRAPGDEAGGTRGDVVDEFTEAIDVMPTVLEWMGADIPRTCDGASLMPFVTKAGDTEARDAAHCEYDFRDTATTSIASDLGVNNDEANFCAIRGSRYKYVHFAALSPLLLDVVEDPHPVHRHLAPPRSLSPRQP